MENEEVWTKNPAVWKSTTAVVMTFVTGAAIIYGFACLVNLTIAGAKWPVFLALAGWWGYMGFRYYLIRIPYVAEAEKSLQESRSDGSQETLFALERRFEKCVLYPILIVALGVAIVALANGSWWFFGISVLVLFVNGLVGQGLQKNRTKSLSQLAAGSADEAECVTLEATRAEPTATEWNAQAPAARQSSAGDRVTKSGGAVAGVSLLPENYEFENDTTQDAVQDAGQAQRSDWDVAATYYADLNELHASLRRTSTKLALAFRATLLETKQFSKGKELAQQLEDDFLRTYFGRTPKILGFARTLIAGGHKAAAKELNRAIAVLGAGDEFLIITQIQRKFDLAPTCVQPARKQAEKFCEQAV
jgi:hypothetical protein